MSHPDFDRGIAPANPISVRTAVDRGHVVITRRVLGIMGILLVAGFGLASFADQPVVGLAIVLAAPFVAWVWWSYATPRWRRWALRRGASAAELQRVAERERLVWPQGHFFERTEFRVRGD